MFVDTNVESSEPIQPDTIGAWSIVPSLQLEPPLEKVLCLPFILLSTDSILLIRFPLLIYRHLIL